MDEIPLTFDVAKNEMVNSKVQKFKILSTSGYGKKLSSQLC
jgi:hypothetical protein